MTWNPLNSLDDVPSNEGWYLVTAERNDERWVEPMRWTGSGWVPVRQGKLNPAPSSGCRGYDASLLAWARLPMPYSPADRVVQLNIEDVVHKPRRD